jgi:hypothetical protein
MRTRLHPNGQRWTEKPFPIAFIQTGLHTYIHTCAFIENSVQETLYDALLTARKVREEWEGYDTLYTDNSHPPIHTVYDTMANKDTVYVWAHMRHQ